MNHISKKIFVGNSNEAINIENATNHAINDYLKEVKDFWKIDDDRIYTINTKKIRDAMSNVYIQVDIFYKEGKK